MRARISKKNVQYFLKQQYAFESINQCFKLTKYNVKLRTKIVSHIVQEFTGYQLKSGKLLTYNPYTSKYESLNIEGFEHVVTSEELFKDLSMLHKTRMEMLEQSRKRILELAKEKKYSRDQDLDIKVQKNDRTQKRLQELGNNTPSPSQELER
jgi:hypothetical protein